MYIVQTNTFMHKLSMMLNAFLAIASPTLVAKSTLEVESLAISLSFDEA
jgi:hypothetical protein